MRLRCYGIDYWERAARLAEEKCRKSLLHVPILSSETENSCGSTESLGEVVLAQKFVSEIRDESRDDASVNVGIAMQTGKLLLSQIVPFRRSVPTLDVDVTDIRKLSSISRIQGSSKRRRQEESDAEAAFPSKKTDCCLIRRQPNLSISKVCSSSATLQKFEEDLALFADEFEAEEGEMAAPRTSHEIEPLVPDMLEPLGGFLNNYVFEALPPVDQLGMLSKLEGQLGAPEDCASGSWLKILPEILAAKLSSQLLSPTLLSLVECHSLLEDGFVLPSEQPGHHLMVKFELPTVVEEAPRLLSGWDKSDMASLMSGSAVILPDLDALIPSQDFETLIVMPELTQDQNLFFTLPVPLFSHQDEVQSLEHLFTVITHSSKLSPTFPSDWLYMDWHISQGNSCNNRVCFGLQRKLDGVEECRPVSYLYSDKLKYNVLLHFVEYPSGSVKALNAFSTKESYAEAMQVNSEMGHHVDFRAGGISTIRSSLNHHICHRSEDVLLASNRHQAAFQQNLESQSAKEESRLSDRRPDGIIIANIAQPGGLLTARRSFYQKLIRLETDCMQVVERELQLPIDLILSPSTCLVLYTREKLQLSDIKIDPASILLPCIDIIADSHMKAMRFSFRDCLMIFEGAPVFTSAVLQIMQSLYAAAAGLNINLQCFVSGSPETTDVVTMKCIERVKGSSYWPISQSVTVAEAFLTEFPSINPLTAHTILSLDIPLPQFMSLSHPEQVSALEGLDVPKHSLMLFKKQCQYGEPSVCQGVLGGQWPSAAEITCSQPILSTKQADGSADALCNGRIHRRQTEDQVDLPFFPPASEVGTNRTVEVGQCGPFSPIDYDTEAGQMFEQPPSEKDFISHQPFWQASLDSPCLAPWSDTDDLQKPGYVRAAFQSWVDRKRNAIDSWLREPEIVEGCGSSQALKRSDFLVQTHSEAASAWFCDQPSTAHHLQSKELSSPSRHVLKGPSRNPSTLDSYRYQYCKAKSGSVLDKQDNCALNRTPGAVWKGRSAVRISTPTNKRAKQALSYQRRGTDTQSRLVWGNQVTAGNVNAPKRARIHPTYM